MNKKEIATTEIDELSKGEQYSEILKKTYLEIDDIVKFTEDRMWDAKNIALVGMIGFVRPGEYVCTPGISAMVQPIGSNWQFGFPCEILEKIDSEPNEVEIGKAIYLNQNRFEIFHQKYGWTGLVKIKGKVKTEDSIRAEIAKIVANLRENRPSKDTKGYIKRLIRILRAFKYHPDEEYLFKLSENLSTIKRESSDDLVNILSDIENWNVSSEVFIKYPVDYGNDLIKNFYNKKRKAIILGPEKS